MTRAAGERFTFSHKREFRRKGAKTFTANEYSLPSTVSNRLPIRMVGGRKKGGPVRLVIPAHGKGRGWARLEQYGSDKKEGNRGHGLKDGSGQPWHGSEGHVPT